MPQNRYVVIFHLWWKRHPLSGKFDNLTLIWFSFARVKP